MTAGSWPSCVGDSRTADPPPSASPPSHDPVLWTKCCLPQLGGGRRIHGDPWACGENPGKGWPALAVPPFPFQTSSSSEKSIPLPPERFIPSAKKCLPTTLSKRTTCQGCSPLPRGVGAPAVQVGDDRETFSTDRGAMGVTGIPWECLTCPK